MAETSVEVGESVEKNDAEDKSTAQGKDTEDTLNNDVLSKSENDSRTSESAVKNLEAEKPSNVATNTGENENPANGKNTDKEKENSQSENLKDVGYIYIKKLSLSAQEELSSASSLISSDQFLQEANVNQETQKTPNHFSEDSVDNTMTMATVEASSTVFKSTEDAGNQDRVEQTSDNLLQSNASVDNRNTEKNLRKENTEIVTEAASTHDNNSTGDELKEETTRDVTSSDENDTDKNIVETDASQDIKNDENKVSSKTEKPELPEDIQSETTTNEVTDENVDVATSKEDNTAKSDIKPRDEISGDKGNIPDEVVNAETEDEDGDAQKTSDENVMSKDEVEKPNGINTEQSKKDSEHGSVDAGKIDTQGDSGLPSEPIEQSRITEGNSSEDESTKSNETPSSTGQTVPENQSKTATKIEDNIPSEKVEGEVNTNKDSGKAEEDLSSNVKEKSEGDYNISKETEKLEQTDTGKKAEKNEEKDNGLENVETKGNAEKSEKEDSGSKNETSEGRNTEPLENFENSAIKQDSQEDDEVSKDTGNEPEVTKDQEDQNLATKQQENEVKLENTEDKKLEGETGDKVSESKKDLNAKDVAESDRKSEISSEKIEGDMNTEIDGGEAKTAEDVSTTEAPADVESDGRSMEVEKDEGLKAGGNVEPKENAEKPKEKNSGYQRQTTEESDMIVEDNDTQQDSAKEGEVSKVLNNEPEVTKDVEDQALESKSNMKGIEKENAGNKTPEGETKDNAIEPEASDIKNSEETAGKSTEKAINESTKAEVITIMPTSSGTEHEIVEDKVDETTSDTKETSAEKAETEIKDNNDHANTILNETNTESGKSEQSKPQDNEENQTVEETAASVFTEGNQVSEETISDTTGEGNNPEQNVVTVSENNKDIAHQVKSEDTDQPKQVMKDAFDIQTDKETKKLDDKISGSGSVDGVIASETFIDQEDKSLPDPPTPKQLESMDDINVAEKSEESKNESESTKPTVDQDDTKETSPQGSADDYITEAAVKSVDQANDDTPAGPITQGTDIKPIVS